MSSQWVPSGGERTMFCVLAPDCWSASQFSAALPVAALQPSSPHHWKVSRGCRDETRHVTHGDLPWSAVTNTKYQLKCNRKKKNLRPSPETEVQQWPEWTLPPRDLPVQRRWDPSVSFNGDCWLPFCLLCKCIYWILNSVYISEK